MNIVEVWQGGIRFEFALNATKTDILLTTTSSTGRIPTWARKRAEHQAKKKLGLMKKAKKRKNNAEQLKLL